MKIKLKSVLLYWLLAYCVVTVIGFAHTFFNGYVLGMPGIPEGATSMYDSEAYAATVPFHILYNLAIWPVFGIILFNKERKALWRNAVRTGIIWAVASIVLDVVGWVLIPHPFRMTAYEMYVDYQPWITLIYLSILVAPCISTIALRKYKESLMRKTKR